MKTSILSVIVAIVILSTYARAQPQNGTPYSGLSPAEVKRVERPGGFAVPNEMTRQQRQEFEKIRMERMKERTQANNLLREKRARLEILQIADKPDMAEINKIIDEISSIQVQEMKAQAAHRQKIRNLLTEKQRSYFDARHSGAARMRGIPPRPMRKHDCCIRKQHPRRGERSFRKADNALVPRKRYNTDSL